MVGALTLSIIIEFLTGGLDSSAIPILEYLGTLWNGAFSAAAFVTLTFAIVERVNEEKEIEELKEFEKFSIDNLPEINDTNKQPTISGTVFEIVMGVIGLAFFTYVLNNNGQLPTYINLASKMTQVRVFTDNFLQFFPVMMAITGLEVARNAMLLVQGRQSSLTNWWHVIMEGAHVVLSVFLLRSFPLIMLKGFQPLFVTAEWDLAQIEPGINTGLKVIIILSLIGTGVEIIRHMFQEAKNPAR